MKKLLVTLLSLILCLMAFAACTPEQPETPDNEVKYDAAAAAAYVFNLYKDNGPITAADFDVTAKVQHNGVSYDVEWTATEGVTVEKKNDTTYTVNVDEESPAEVAYTLTATVKAADGTSATKTFNFTVPKYNLTSFEDYMAAAENDNVVVKGIVVAINSKAAGNKYNHLFLADLQGKGGYYCYSITQDPVADLGIELGMTVEVSGPVVPYSGMQEIKGGSARIVDTTKKDVAALDITEKFIAGESLANYVGLPVTIKGVEIKGQELEKETSQYLKFELEGKSSYLRTYVTDFPTTLPVDKKGEIDAAHAEKFGYKANVTGILVLYNSAPYLIPMDTNCFEYLAKVEKTPEQKIADTLGELSLPASFNKDAVVDLPAAGTAYADVLLTWTSNNEAAVIADGKLTVTIPTTAVEVTITVTATCGEATETKTFTITLTKLVDPNTYLEIPQANEIGLLMGHNTYTEGKYFVTGEITEIKNDTYGNLYIKNANGDLLYVYGVYSADGATRFDALATKPAVGDTITVYGVLGQYNGNAQMKNAWLVSQLPEANGAIALPGANAIGLAQGHNKYTTDKYTVTGVITKIANAKYGNVYIQDEKGNTFYIYGLYSADGATRFDALTTQPAVGDTITVLGVLGQYNGGAQMKNGWITTHTPAAPEGGEGGEGGETPTPSVPAGDALATFTFGDNGDAAHVDGQDLGTDAQYTAGEYTLALTGMSKVYGPAFDATGNSCIKLGTSSKTATLSFTVADGVNKVVIRVAAYKANNAKVTVNGTEYDISANKSNDGSYFEITVDTSATKTVTLATVEGACRAMIDSIAYYAN